MLSVVVVHRQRADDTLTCLRLLQYALDYPADRLQILCVDPSETGEIGAVPGVQVVSARPDLTFAASSNLGARQAKGSVVAFLHADARPEPGWALAGLRALSAPGVGAVACQILDGDAVPSDDTRDVRFADGAAMFVRAGAFQALGGFAETLTHDEDIDFGLRLSATGWRIHYTPTAMASRPHKSIVDRRVPPEEPPHQRRILLVTGDAISERMAGPAIRAWNMADVLSAEHDVRLVTVNPLCTPAESSFRVLRSKIRDIDSHVAWADVVIVQGHALEMAPSLKKPGSTKIVVCDVYDPMHLELLEQGKDDIAEKRDLDLAAVTTVLNNQLERGDFFLCASDRQRHFWLGHLLALGRLTTDLYDADRTLRSLLDIAPFGLPGTPPRQNRSAIKGAVPGISADDRVVLWAGGVYNWFDPITLVDAVATLAQRRSDVRLLFLGMKHPNPEVPEMGIGAELRARSADLGLTGKHVFFNETWVAYEERQDWLLDADCGVTTHFDHVETTFAFRTRVLDYLWAGLPIVTTDGDAFADLVRQERLGLVVPAEDPEALADALERVLYDAEFARECAERIAGVRERFTWDTVLAPLTAFCRAPRPAIDRLPGARPLVRRPALNAVDTVRRDLALVREYLDSGGATELARRATGRVLRIARERLGSRRDG